MRGQLWQECPNCDDDPVCVDCEYCRRHCTCEQVASDRRCLQEFERENPGLIGKYDRYREEAAQEHD